MHPLITSLTVTITLTTTAGDEVAFDLILSRSDNHFTSQYSHLPASAFDPNLVTEHNKAMRELRVLYPDCTFATL